MRVGCRGEWLARETRARALHAIHAACGGEKLCSGPCRTSNAAGGLPSSTIGRRPQVDDRDTLVGIKTYEQDVKKPQADRKFAFIPVSISSFLWHCTMALPPLQK